jgi:DNA-binding NarL/FixJ family response regulator
VGAPAKRSVLLVAVDDDLRLLLRLFVEEDSRLEVVGEAGSIDDALDQAAALQPEVVVLDERFGEEAGADVAPDLIDAAAAARIVLLVLPFSGPELLPIAVHALVAKDRLVALPRVITGFLHVRVDEPPPH